VSKLQLEWRKGSISTLVQAQDDIARIKHFKTSQSQFYLSPQQKKQCRFCSAVMAAPPMAQLTLPTSAAPHLPSALVFVLLFFILIF
jgi:hypothetical protein